MYVASLLSNSGIHGISIINHQYKDSMSTPEHRDSFMTLLTFEVQVIKKLIPVIRTGLHAASLVQNSYLSFYSFTHIYSMNYVLQNAK